MAPECHVRRYVTCNDSSILVKTHLSKSITAKRTHISFSSIAKETTNRRLLMYLLRRVPWHFDRSAGHPLHIVPHLLPYLTCNGEGRSCLHPLQES